MTRYRLRKGKLEPLSPERELERDQEEAAWELELQRRADVEYQKKRQRAYPKMGDQFDRIFKFLKANKDILESLGFEMQEVVEYVRDVQKVKDENPKPERR